MVLGFLGLTLGILILFFPAMGLLILVIILAIGLLFLGITRLGTAIAEPGLPGWLRALGIVVGLLAIALWILVLIFPGFALALLVAFLSVGLIFQGISLVGVDGMNQEAPGWARGFGVAVGILLLIFGFLVLFFPFFGLTTAVVFFSIALIIAGISAIAAGITGVSMETTTMMPAQPSS